MISRFKIAATLVGAATAATLFAAPAMAASAASPATATTSRAAALQDAVKTAVSQTGAVSGATTGATVPAAVAACWRCEQGPAATLVADYIVNGNTTSLTRGVKMFDKALTAQQPNGSFVPTSGAMSADIDTMFFAAELGSTYKYLAPHIDAAHKTAYTNSIAKAADYLAANGNITYYSNGNLNIGNVVVFAAAWKATGKAIYKTDMDNAYTFLMNPTPASRWAGKGFVTTKAATKADGSDGSGYLVETAPGQTVGGYDPDYTQLQMSQASRWYLLTNDPRALKLVNMLLNQLLARTTLSNFHIDVSGGSRHPAAGSWRNMISPALSAVVWHGGRTDLAGYVSTQLNATAINFGAGGPYGDPGTWYSTGLDLAMTVFSASQS